MAELADALDSGSNGRKAVQVQVLLPAPSKSCIHAGAALVFCPHREGSCGIYRGSLFCLFLNGKILISSDFECII